MAIKSTKKVLVSVLSFAVFSQPFCGAIKNFMENKVDPRKSIVIKKEKPTGFDKIKEFAKKHPVKAAVGGVVGLGTVIIVGGIIVKNALFGDKNILTAEDVKSTDKKLGVFSRFTFEGIYEYLCRCGFDEWNAYVFACGVRRGTLSRNGISEEQKKLINTHNIPREFCNACLQADHIPLYAEEQEALYTDVTGVFFMLTYPDVILNAD